MLTADPPDRPARRGPSKRYEARREAIVAAAVEAVNRRGVRGMTLGEVAAQLGLVPTGVIYYFKSKEDLARAAFLKAVERYDAMIAAAETFPTERERLAAFVSGYFAFYQDVAMGRAQPIVVFNDVRALDAEPVNVAYVAMFRRARRLLDRREDRSAAGRNARTHLLLSQLFWVTAWLFKWRAEDHPRVLARMLTVLLDGMAAPGGAWPAPVALSLERADPQDGAAEPFLTAATQLINEEGYHGASVERISAKLNLTKGAFYHHNETKDDLVVACFQRTFDIIWQAIGEAEALSTSGLQTLVAVASALVERQMRGGAPLLRTSALTTVPEPIRWRLEDKLARITLRLASIVSDGVADGSIRPVDTAIAAEVLTAATNAAAELHFWAPGVTAETVDDLYVRPLFAGLVA